MERVADPLALVAPINRSPNPVMEPQVSNWIRCFVLAVALAAGCSETVPTDPSWAEHVRPILSANCIRCHSVPALGGAPNSFRLDRYDDTVTEDGRVIRGAGTMAEFIHVRTDDPESAGVSSMPPRFKLNQRQVDTLALWAEQRSAGSRPPQGATPSNRRPSFTLRSELRFDLTVDGKQIVQYEIRDPDRDIVSGELRFSDSSDTSNSTDSSIAISSNLHSGRGQAVWDVGALPQGSYRLFAVLDDGSARTEHVIDEAYQVVHSDNNVAPTLALTAPITDEILPDLEAPQELLITVADPNPDDNLVLSVTATRDDQTIVIAENVAAVAGENRIEWDTRLVMPNTDVTGGWRLHITLSDGTATRTAESGPLFVSHVTASETGGFPPDDEFPAAGTVAELLFFRCTGCHPGGGRIPDLDQDFRRLETVDGVPGVKALRGRIYRRIALQRNMPPKTAFVFGEPDLSDDERARLTNWLLGGTPQ